MSPLWDYFWPALTAGMVVGIVDGTYGFRRRRGRRYVALALGIIASIALAALWHGPLGAADRFSAAVERGAQRALVYYEITEVRAHLHHGPLTRRVMLSGPADDFQRSELARHMGEVPGVADASWSNGSGGVPLIAEGAAVAVLGFLLGLLVAYLVELRRRYNAQWNW
jgi:hypothetical protein